MLWSWSEEQHTDSRGDEPESKSSSNKATGMMFPLAVALAYLDAIAKTWLAIGEKLHESIYGNPNSTSSSSQARGMRRTARSRTSSQKKDHDRCHNANRLEFSLGDFLRSKMHDPLGAYRSNQTMSEDDLGELTEQTRQSSADVQARSSTVGVDHAAHSATGASSSSWSRCLRIARKPKGLPSSSRPRATDKTLVLDLDETLIHARKHSTIGDGRFDFMVVLPPRTLGGISIRTGRGGANGSTSVPVGKLAAEAGAGTAGLWARAKSRDWRFGFSSKNKKCSSLGAGRKGTSESGASSGDRRVYVQKRPYLREFLKAASAQFEVVVFTAARADFATKVLEHIDPNREMVDHVLSRESCTRLMLSRKKRAAVVKDLGIIGRPLSKVIMVENSLDAIRYHLENGVHISSFYGDRSDKELLSTLEVLRELAPATDVRDGIISRYVETQARKEKHAGGGDNSASVM